MNLEVVTIGAYGFDSDSFFEALVGAEVDTFCDLRARRGVRGSEYAWANRRRLEARLAELGIRYLHFPALAPPAEIRSRQYAADRVAGTTKRLRAELSEEFRCAYTEQCLALFDSAAFVAGLGAECRRPALFCVEREPAACHRSLLADRLAADLGVTLRHLLPPDR